MDYNDDVAAYYRAREAGALPARLEIRPGSKLDTALRQENELRGRAGLLYAPDYSFLYRASESARRTLGIACEVIDAAIDDEANEVRTGLESLRAALLETHGFSDEFWKCNFDETLEIITRMIVVVADLKSPAAVRKASAELNKLIDAGYASVESPRPITNRAKLREMLAIALKNKQPISKRTNTTIDRDRELLVEWESGEHKDITAMARAVTAREGKSLSRSALSHALDRARAARESSA